jgi:hypothetical protein
MSKFTLIYMNWNREQFNFIIFMLQIQFKVNAPYEPYATLKLIGSIG